jgi:excinuclease ABC subunit B
MAKFKLTSEYKPQGDQPEAIKKLVKGVGKYNHQTLLGVTGSGKTFTIANVIESVGRPALVLAHNKTLAAQLYEELKELFPENKVCYFISFYDYYQPESYLPSTDTYIEKDMSINERIEEFRMEAMVSAISREDTIIVASVSCIYPLGDPESYQLEIEEVRAGEERNRDEFLRQLILMGFERNDTDLQTGKFRVNGDTIDLIQGFGGRTYRIEFFGDVIDSIKVVETQNNKIIEALDRIVLYPPTPYVTTPEKREHALQTIAAELETRLPELGDLEAHRLKTRTRHDMEMIRELGRCKGIENYSLHFDGRKSGEPGHTLLDFLPEDFMLIVDESHQTLSQVRAMYNGDRARKEALIEHGFRLPSAYDNRPLKFEEFKKFMNNVIYVSATPGDYELDMSEQVVEQLIRPTGLVDPEITVKKTEGQIDDVIEEIDATVKNGNRVLITTLTKKMAEDFTEYLLQRGIKVNYLHSEIDTLERTQILHALRRGEFDVLVGINLLREGLDLPEVELVAIMDADKEGFLRDERSLIQTIGRAARNVDGRVIMYADSVTGSMKRAIKETDRRRKKQVVYNEEHGITPESIKKKLAKKPDAIIEELSYKPKQKVANIEELIREMEIEMEDAASNLDFEKAITLRDEIKKLQSQVK